MRFVIHLFKPIYKNLSISSNVISEVKLCCNFSRNKHLLKFLFSLITCIFEKSLNIILRLYRSISISRIKPLIYWRKHVKIVLIFWERCPCRLPDKTICVIILFLKISITTSWSDLCAFLWETCIYWSIENCWNLLFYAFP